MIYIFNNLFFITLGIGKLLIHLFIRFIRFIEMSNISLLFERIGRYCEFLYSLEIFVFEHSAL